MPNTMKYVAGDRTFDALLFAPEVPSRGSVLLFHGGHGIVAHERERAAKLASSGYLVVVPDLYGEAFADAARGREVIGALRGDATLIRERVTGALRALLAVPSIDPARVFAVGHCFGGYASLELARSGADVAVVVSLHGALGTSQKASEHEVRARVIACTGADDAYCPREDRVAFEDEMTKARARWEHHVYGGATHGFSVPGIEYPGCAHHEAFDRRSWATMLAAFDEG